jgi:hypothetical protein
VACPYRLPKLPEMYSLYTSSSSDSHTVLYTLWVEFSGQNASAVEIWNNMKNYVEDQKSSIFVIIAPNNLNWIGL